jgi:peptidoglycan/xylan/chitin deacetylase (PgdA/CDA1 family)
MTSLRPLTQNHRPIPILVYHQIDEAPEKGRPFRSLYVAPRAFARQMALLKVLGYTGLSMSALMPYLRGEKTGKVVGITFDDGYLNNLTNALPVLARQGFSSTCYVVSGLLGQTNVWDEKIGIAQTPLMDEGQLRQWVAGDQELASHTHRHINLQTSTDEDSAADIQKGKTALEAITAQNVEHFCYPYGGFDVRHVGMAVDVGFVTATTTQRSRCQPGADLMQLPRVPVVRSTSLPVFWLKIATGYEDRHQS